MNDQTNTISKRVRNERTMNRITLVTAVVISGLLGAGINSYVSNSNQTHSIGPQKDYVQSHQLTTQVPVSQPAIATTQLSYAGVNQPSSTESPAQSYNSVKTTQPSVPTNVEGSLDARMNSMLTKKGSPSVWPGEYTE